MKLSIENIYLYYYSTYYNIIDIQKVNIHILKYVEHFVFIIFLYLYD